MRDPSNVDLVKRKFEELKQIVDDFNMAHTAYHEKLTNEHDKAESSEYFKAVNESLAELECGITDWMKSKETASAQRQSPPTQTIPEIHPDDSISNVGSRHSTKLTRLSKSSSGCSKKSRSSSLSAAKARAAAKRATLEAEAANLERLHAIQQEELKLKRKRKELELETELAKAQGEENVYILAESSQVGSYADLDLSTRTLKKSSPIFVPDPQRNPVRERSDPPPAATSAKTVPLNPTAKSWVPEKNFQGDRKPPRPSGTSHVPSIKKSQVKVEPDESKHGHQALIGALTQSFLEAQIQQDHRMQELIQRQQESTLALTLPQPEVPTFSGNPTEYWTFIRAFENLIERRTTSESARLYYLVQYTTGEVRELVKSCLTMREDAGYQKARDLLKKRYGQSYRIASAFVDKLAKGSAIKAEDGEALRRFSILLTSCKNTLQDIGYLNKVENPDTMKTIVSRLPYGLRQKWRDVADNITENQGREITIGDLSNFVTSKARAATHAVFGDLQSHPPSSAGGVKSKQKPAPRNASSFATQTESKRVGADVNRQQLQNDRKCPLCGLKHWLSQCSAFKEKSLSDRLSFVRSKGLCDNCLVPGHTANSCPKPRFCRVTGCTGNHSSFLHPRSVGQIASPSATNLTSTEVKLQTQDGPPEVLNGYVKGRSEEASNSQSKISAVTGLAVVPVKVKVPGRDGMVQTYAFLDSGSNTSFCSEDLAKQLGLSGQRTTLSLTTMEKEHSKTESLVVSLEVLDLEEENLVELPIVFTRPKLPVSWQMQLISKILIDDHTSLVSAYQRLKQTLAC